MRAPGGSCEHLGTLGGHFGRLGAPFGLILILLGRFLASFWPCWDVLGRLGTPFSPKLAQVGPRYRKKPRFLDLISGSWLKLGAKNRETSTSKTMFFLDAFSTSIFIDF